MRVALFGGTFNPVHRGHLLIAKAAKTEHKLDRLIFIPAGKPPHKKEPSTSASHRLAMLRLALRGHPSFKISMFEIQAKRVVYTYQTVEHFKKLYPKDALYFLLGEDAKKSFPKWKYPERIKGVCRLIPARRLPSFASSDIRSRVARGMPIRYLVPPRVQRYIYQQRLYLRPE